MKKSFTIVYIPHNVDERIEERVVEYDDSTIVSCLTDNLKLHFKKRHTTSSNNRLSEYMSDLKSKIKETNPTLPTDALAKQMASIQLVDIVPLLQQRKENKWECVSMYVDDNGLNKGIPMNKRAMQICMMCCAAPREIAGDVFLARAIDDNADLYERRDFKIADLNSSAPWVEMARGINLKNVKNMAAQRKISDEDMKKTQDLKSQGNSCFGKAQFEEACEKYQEAIGVLNVTDPRHEHADLSQVLWMNLAAAELKRSKHANALAASSNALAFGPKAKAYYRRACAYEGMKQWSKACSDLKEALKLNPRDKSIKSKLNQLKQKK